MPPIAATCLQHCLKTRCRSTSSSSILHRFTPPLALAHARTLAVPDALVPAHAHPCVCDACGCVYLCGRRAGGQWALEKLDWTSTAARTARIFISVSLTHAALSWPRCRSFLSCPLSWEYPAEGREGGSERERESARARALLGLSIPKGVFCFNDIVATQNVNGTHILS